jgi:pyruvate/2-oxoglutarate dehydrogenase complex dihydrolipoamide acyltransferase (E2) component
MARIEIRVPDLGMDSKEISFGLWLKELDDEVEADEDLFEIEADKATVVCESPASGVLVVKEVTEGSVKPGDVVGYLNAR